MQVEVDVDIKFQAWFGLDLIKLNEQMLDITTNLKLKWRIVVVNVFVL
jgi:hypothetical protein